MLINLKMGLDEEENYNMGLLKEKIFQSFNKIRVYTKNPAQKAHSDKPLILNKGSTVKDVAEKIDLPNDQHFGNLHIQHPLVMKIYRSSVLNLRNLYQE